MNLQATKEIKVFIDNKYYSNTPIELTEIGKIPNDRRINISWKGCYYIIKKDEKFIFDRTNNYDRCYFKLENGAEFLIYCGNPQSFIKNHNINTINI